jgi:hypothetical protein
MPARCRISANARALSGLSPTDYVETETATVDGRRVYRLALRALQSAPGMGHISVLYRPEVVSIDSTIIVLRGIERVQLADGIAGLVQEWAVQF